ncbi:MAG TPA: hypothetical protein VN182_03915 [Flavobacterium sp.]|nr:hypothetical protein [Flavobacterium sp.]
MRQIKLLFLILLFSISFESFSQISISGYTNYVVGINTNKEKRISFDAKVFANNYIEDLPIEFNAFFNFKTKEYHRISIGLGVNLSPFNGIDQMNSFVIPTSLEIFPMKDFKRIAIVFELTPEIRIEDEVVIRSLLGVRYTFGKK